MVTKRFQLDPNLSARENLWAAAKLSSMYWLRRKKLKLFRTEWDELICNLTYRTVLYFMQRLRRGLYNRSESFLYNVLSCARSVQNPVIKKFITDVKNRINSTDHMETLAFDPDNHPLVFHPKSTRQGLLTAIERDALGVSYAVHQVHFEPALRYFWACEDEEAAYEHKVIDKAENIRKRQMTLAKVHALLNGGKTHDQLYQREYHRAYYWKNREKIIANQKAYKRRKKAAKMGCSPLQDQGQGSQHPSQQRDDAPLR